MTRSAVARVAHVFREVISWIAIAIGTLLILEGAASAFLFLRDFRGAPVSSRPLRPHTAHDTLLGWRNVADYSKPNEYGKGIALALTAPGIRRTAAIDSAKPLRTVLCTGDVYTFGAGVSDEHTWCSLLARQLPGVRTYNMAQETYGLDQLYLWYARDGQQLSHDAQVLALTNAMLERATSNNDMGWSKPYIALNGASLRITNVPVPEQSADALRAVNTRNKWGDVRIVEAVRRLPRFRPDRQRSARVDEHRAVFESVIVALAARHRSRNTQLVLAYLPGPREVRSNDLDARRQWLAEFARRSGLTLVDLTASLRALRNDSLDLAFISRTSPVITARAADQYSRLGHTLIARTLAPYLEQPTRTENK